MSTEREDLEAQLRYLDAQDAFIAAKASGRDSAEYQSAKAELREIRTAMRTARDTAVDDGSATATPATVGLTSTISEG